MENAKESTLLTEESLVYFFGTEFYEEQYTAGEQFFDGYQEDEKNLDQLAHAYAITTLTVLAEKLLNEKIFLLKGSGH